MMDTFNVPENVKPSRVNRKRKRRWKIGTALRQLTQPKIRLGLKALTDCGRLAQNLATAPHWAVGRGNLFYIGVKPPQPYVVFLCASYFSALCRLSFMAVCLGSFRAGWLPMSSISTPLQPASQAVESLIGGLHP